MSKHRKNHRRRGRKISNPRIETLPLRPNALESLLRYRIQGKKGKGSKTKRVRSLRDIAHIGTSKLLSLPGLGTMGVLKLQSMAYDYGIDWKYSRREKAFIVRTLAVCLFHRQ